MELKFFTMFITPLLIGGGETQGRNIKCDPNGLNAKALRGAWRFWFRALYGGLGHKEKKCLELENQIFGSTEKTTLRIKVIPISRLSPSEFPTLPHKRGGQKAYREGFPPETKFQISVWSRPSFEREKNFITLTRWLQLSIALWSSLGSIGCRSRRGFGSPDVDMKRCDESLRKLFTPLDLESVNTLAISLRSRLNAIRNLAQTNFSDDALIDLDQDRSSPTWERNYPPSSPYPFFQLRSLDQVFVGKSLGTDRDNAITQIHGSSEDDDLGYADGEKRLASPWYLRLFQLQGGQYVPVATFCPEKDKGRKVSWERQRPQIPDSYKRIFSKHL